MVLGACLTSLVAAQEVYRTLEPMKVVGSREEIVELPGSAAVVDAKEFRERGYTNIAQIAARVPGVYVRNEDGYGNFPNISLRGVDGNRSTKVTMMEDGILTAPSPYSAPNAYYSPKAGRMASIEFLKGSSQVKYGPQTTGGVVNYISTPVPTGDGPRFFSRSTYGSDNTIYNHTWHGDAAEGEQGKIGYLLEFHGSRSDGYRNIDGSGSDSGFDYVEPMLKLFWEPASTLKQRFEFKAGFTDFDADETYTGLTESDLRANPDRRYAATRYDRMESEQFRTYLKWIAEPTDEWRVESALYANTFRRNWDKLNGLKNTTREKIDQALMDSTALSVLQGFGSGSIVTRDAFRDHESYGWQNQVNHKFEIGVIEHDLAMGLRLHYDRVGAYNTDTNYESNGVGGFRDGVRGATSFDGLQQVLAKSVYLEDSIQLGQFSLRPGVRYEMLDVEYTYFEKTKSAITHRESDEELLMAGVGFNYEFFDVNSLFGGVYRGASPANPKGYVNQTEREESLGYELGFRHKNDALRAELVGFYTNFDDLLSPDLPGAGGTTEILNAGSADCMGLESVVQYDFGSANGWAYELPIYLSATYTHAEFSGINERLIDQYGLFAGAVSGNQIPYIPEWKLGAGIGLALEKWAANLDASYDSTSWGTGYNDDARSGNTSAMDGKIDSLLIFDLTGHYQLNSDLKLVGGIQNLFDTRKIVSRAPLGPRANAPRMIYAGLELEF